VIAAGFGYGPLGHPGFRLFIQSFADAGLASHAEGFLLVHPPPHPPLLEQLALQSGMRLMVADRDYDSTAHLKAVGISIATSAALRSSAHQQRWFYAYAALTSYRHCFDKVVTTDTRDAYFQASPFPYITAPGFYATQEQIRTGMRADGKPTNVCCTVHNNPYNRRWIDAINPGAADALTSLYGGDVPISCSAISLGTTDAFRSYLLAMIQMFEQLSQRQYQQAGGVGSIRACTT